MRILRQTGPGENLHQKLGELNAAMDHGCGFVSTGDGPKTMRQASYWFWDAGNTRIYSYTVHTVYVVHIIGSCTLLYTHVYCVHHI